MADANPQPPVPTLRGGPVTEEELDELLTRPTAGSLRGVRSLDNDLVVLGAGGKMGPSLAVLARRSLDELGLPHRVVCVSRFSSPTARAYVESAGVETVACDLLDRQALDALPDAPNVLFMAGMKFGASASPSTTWAINVLLPGLVASRYREARIVALSTGNVYPLAAVDGGGATESTPLAPVGEYAQSCLGRERMFEFGSQRHGTPVALVRLNYATDLRYGVLLDIARQVAAELPVRLDTGYANTIWQGDANAVLLQAFAICGSPAAPLNLTGPETFSVREVAHRFAELLGVAGPFFAGADRDTALLSDASRCHELFGVPGVSLDELVEWTAAWVRRGGPTLGMPTRFDVRDGTF